MLITWSKGHVALTLQVLVGVEVSAEPLDNQTDISLRLPLSLDWNFMTFSKICPETFQ